MNPCNSPEMRELAVQLPTTPTLQMTALNFRRKSISFFLKLTVSVTTEFNTKKLLNGGASVSGTVILS